MPRLANTDDIEWVVSTIPYLKRDDLEGIGNNLLLAQLLSVRGFTMAVKKSMQIIFVLCANLLF